MMKSRTKLTTLILSVIMTLMLCIGLVPMFATTASAASAETPTYDATYQRIEGRGTPLLIEAGTNGGTAVSYMSGGEKKYVNQSGAKGDDLSSATIYGGAHTTPSGTFYTEGFITMTGGSVGEINAGNFSNSTAYIGSVRLIITGGSVGYIDVPEPRTVPVTMMFVTIQDAEDNSNILNAKSNIQNGIYKSGSEYAVVGNAEVPEGFSLTIAEGESLTVDSGEVLNNNGTITNNGTVAVNGTLNNNATFNNNGTIAMNAPMGSGESTISGNAIVRNAMYIKTASTGATPTVYVNGTEVSGVSTEYIDGKLYIYPLQTGNVKAVLNGTTYYGIINSTSGEHALSSTYNKVTDIQFSLTELQAGKMVDLAGYTTLVPDSLTYPTTVTYEILSGGTSSVSMDGSKLLASAGTFQLKITATDGFSEYSETFTITVPASDTIDVGTGSVVITQKDSNTYTVTWQGFEGGSKDYSADTPIVITGTTDTHNITVNSGEPNLVLQDVNIQAKNPLYIAPNAKVNLTLSGANVLKGSASAGIVVRNGATLVIDGTGSLNATGDRASGMDEGSAGIGGDYAYWSDDGSYCGTIIINGGVVSAQGAGGGAGIGGACMGSFEKIEINGGTVTATGAKYFNSSSKTGAGIGTGYNADNLTGTIVITGGTIKAVSASAGYGEAVGLGSYNDNTTVTITNGTSPVSLVTVTLIDASTAEAVADGIAVTGMNINYGVSGVRTMDGGKLYLYLPSDTELTSITLENGNTYFIEASGSSTVFGTNVDLNNKPETDAGGVYLISDVDDLIWFSQYVILNNDICGKLTANIDATGSAFKSIGTLNFKYAGTFDGNGKTLTVALTGEGSVAPFGYLDGSTIRNLCVAGSINASGQYAAGIASHTYGNTLIENCIVSVEITSTVSGDGTHGGLVGLAEEGCSLTINNCAFIGSIKGGDTDRCGGFVGWSTTACTIKNSYVAATFTVSVNDSNTFARSNHTLENCYYLNTLGGVNAGAKQKDAAAFASGEVAGLLNGGSSDGIWKQTIGEDDLPSFDGSVVYKTHCVSAILYKNENISYDAHDYSEDNICTRCGSEFNKPETDESGVYLIYTIENLQYFSDMVNSGDTTASAKLMANIDMSAYPSFAIGFVDTDGDTNDTSVKYSGIFDGNGYTLTIALNGGLNMAPFKALNGATIKNLHVAGTITASDKYASGIAAHTYGNTVIENCIVSVVINSTVNGDGTHAGFVGVAEGGTLTINNCAFIGAINGSSTTSCGGFVGWGNVTATIKNSYIAATFTVSSDSSDTFVRNKLSLENCYYLNALGSVSSGATQKSADAFASGEVACLLNGSSVGTDSAVWKQTIDTDAYPGFTGSTIYKATCGDSFFYSNEDGISYSSHDFSTEGICNRCGAFQPATLVTADNRGDWQLDETYVDYYAIGNAGQLNWFANHVGAGNTTAKAVLTNSIDMSAYPSFTIGSSSNAYAGTFDGNDKTLTLALDGGNCTALISYASGATVKNLTLEGTLKTSGKYSGGFIGKVIGGTNTIENCVTSLEMTFTISDDGTHGGFVGLNEGVLVIKNSAFVGSFISGTSFNNGGFVGWTANENGTTIENCYLAADFSGHTNQSGCNTFARNDNVNKTIVINSYYLNSFGGVNYGTKPTAEQLASGEIAYLLGSAWGVTSETDSTPKLGGEAAPAENYILVGQQLNLGADLSMKYYVYGYKYVNGEKAELSLSLLKMQFFFLGELTEVQGKLDPDTGYCVFVLENINPQCLGEKIDATFFCNGKEKATKKNYSVEDNLNNLLKTYKEDVYLVSLINNILAYGEVAEAKTGYTSTDNTDYGSKSSERTIPTAEYTWEGGTGSAGEYIRAFAIRFGTMTHIKIQLQKALGEYTLTIDGEAATLTSDASATYPEYVGKGIAASRFSDDIEICIMNGTTVVEKLTVSVNDLLYLAYKSYSSVDSSYYNNLANLTKALYNYGYAAHNYEGHNFGEDDVCISCGTKQLVTISATDMTASELGEKVRAAVDEGTLVLHVQGTLTDEQKTALADALANETIIVSFENMKTTEFNAEGLAETVALYGTDSSYFKRDDTYYVFSASGLSTALTDTNNPTIKLMASFSSGTITSTGSYTLDLNGQTVDFGSSSNLNITGGTVTIKDSGGGGTLKNYIDSSTGLIEISGSNTNVTIQSGSYIGNHWVIRIQSGGSNNKLTIEGGTFAGGAGINGNILIPSATGTLVVKNAPQFTTGSSLPDIYIVSGVQVDLSEFTGDSITLKSTVAQGSLDFLKLPTDWSIYYGETEVTSLAEKTTYTIKPKQ